MGAMDRELVSEAIGRERVDRAHVACGLERDAGDLGRVREGRERAREIAPAERVDDDAREVLRTERRDEGLGDVDPAAAILVVRVPELVAVACDHGRVEASRDLARGPAGGDAEDRTRLGREVGARERGLGSGRRCGGRRRCGGPGGLRRRRRRRRRGGRRGCDTAGARAHGHRAGRGVRSRASRAAEGHGRRRDRETPSRSRARSSSLHPCSSRRERARNATYAGMPVATIPRP